MSIHASIQSTDAAVCEAASSAVAKAAASQSATKNDLLLFPEGEIDESLLTSKVTTDYLTYDQKRTAELLRLDFEDYFAGENEWKENPEIGDFEAKKPSGFPWLSKEATMIGLLIQADVKFKKAWEEIMQYGCTPRTLVAVEGKWYQLRKSQYVGGDPEDDKDRIIEAKALALELLRERYKEGVPELGPKPLSYKEEVMVAKEYKERGIDTKDLDPTSRDPKEILRKRKLLEAIMERKSKKAKKEE